MILCANKISHKPTSGDVLLIPITYAKSTKIIVKMRLMRMLFQLHCSLLNVNKTKNDSSIRISDAVANTYVSTSMSTIGGSKVCKG